MAEELVFFEKHSEVSSTRPRTVWQSDQQSVGGGEADDGDDENPFMNDVLIGDRAEQRLGEEHRQR